jgi:hypothetical protein
MNRIHARCAAVACLILVGPALAGPDENDVYMLRAPEHTLQEVEKAYSEMPPVTYHPPVDRWEHLPITASALGKGEGTLRIVMLGDSIVNDTSRSRWDDLLRKAYPKCRIDRTTCVRGGTGCWWYKDPSRLKRYVLDLNPDLLIVGGISHITPARKIRTLVPMSPTRPRGKGWPPPRCTYRRVGLGCGSRRHPPLSAHEPNDRSSMVVHR